MKRIITTLLLCVVLSTVAMGGLFDKFKKSSGKDDGPQVLKIWAFTDELQVVVDDFKALHPGLEVEFTIIPNEDYATKLNPVLRTGVGAPDVFLGEVVHVKKWLDSGQWENLDKFAPEATAKYREQSPDYVVGLGQDKKGNLRALSWQSTPGGFFYRRSLAKKYLGTDDPKEVSAMISSPEKFLEVGRLLNEESNGEVKLITSFADYQWIPQSARKSGWVNSDNELYIDDETLGYFDMAKTLRDEDLTNKVDQWTPSWYSAMNSDATFGFILPTWGLSYVLMNNAPDTAGDWGLATGPSSYYWGGTWLGVYSKSENKDLAFEFVEMLTIDNEYMEAYARKIGDFMSNLDIDKTLAEGEGGEFLAGQNHYEFFLEEAKNIKEGLETKYDNEINAMMIDSIRLYVEGELTKDEALNNFKDLVRGAYPNIIVK